MCMMTLKCHLKYDVELISQSQKGHVAMHINQRILIARTITNILNNLHPSAFGLLRYLTTSYHSVSYLKIQVQGHQTHIAYQ